MIVELDNHWLYTMIINHLFALQILKESGVPDGVYNVIQGEGETGSLLTGHPGCDKLSFTGSVATGMKIMQVRKFYNPLNSLCRVV